MDAANSSGVIRGAPPGNRPGETRGDGLGQCTPSRTAARLPHVWEIHRQADGTPSGRMFCLWCGKKTLMKRFTGTFAPAPLCEKTGY